MEHHYKPIRQFAYVKTWNLPFLLYALKDFDDFYEAFTEPYIDLNSFFHGKGGAVSIVGVKLQYFPPHSLICPRKFFMKRNSIHWVTCPRKLSETTGGLFILFIFQVSKAGRGVGTLRCFQRLLSYGMLQLSWASPLFKTDEFKKIIQKASVSP